MLQAVGEVLAAVTQLGRLYTELKSPERKAIEGMQSLTVKPPSWWPLLVERRLKAMSWSILDSEDAPSKVEKDALRCSLSNLVNEKLDQHVSVNIEVRRRERHDWRLDYLPKNLLGAMWLQYARGLTRDEKVARWCKRCETRLDRRLPSGRRRRKDCFVWTQDRQG